MRGYDQNLGSYQDDGSSQDSNTEKTSCPLYRHDVKCHQGVQQKYATEILASEKKIVKLNCLEAIRIERQPSNLLPNHRNEKGRGGVVRITETRQ